MFATGEIVGLAKWIINDSCLVSSCFSFYCDICGREFLRKYDMQRHKNNIHGENNAEFKCHKCEYKNAQKVNVESHIKRVHVLVSCNQCDYKIDDKFKLKDHLKNVHEIDDRMFKCELCDFATFKKQNLDSHVDCVHKKLKNFPCDICGKKFGEKSKMRAHVKRVHQKVECYKCTICDSGFGTHPHLVSHMVSHENAKKRSCKLCNEQFLKKSSLKDHVKVCGQDANCKMCGKIIKWKKIQKRLQKAEDGQLDDNMLKCRSCKKQEKEDVELEEEEVEENKSG